MTALSINEVNLLVSQNERLKQQNKELQYTIRELINELENLKHNLNVEKRRNTKILIMGRANAGENNSQTAC